MHQMSIHVYSADQRRLIRTWLQTLSDLLAECSFLCLPAAVPLIPFDLSAFCVPKKVWGHSASRSVILREIRLRGGASECWRRRWRKDKRARRSRWRKRFVPAFQSSLRNPYHNAANLCVPAAGLSGRLCPSSVMQAVCAMILRSLLRCCPATMPPGREDRLRLGVAR